MASDAMIDRLVVTERHEIAVARRRVRAAASTLYADVEWLDAVVLATSEIVTNAIEYGSGGPVDITIEGSESGVTVQVAGDSTGIPIPPVGPVPTTSIRGRGLLVVQALADHVTIEAQGERVTVTCRFDAPR